jgi:hypothetical protein
LVGAAGFETVLEGSEGVWRGRNAGFTGLLCPSNPLVSPELAPQLAPGRYQASARTASPPRGQAYPQALTQHIALGAAYPCRDTEAAEAVEAGDLIAAHVVVACGFLNRRPEVRVFLGSPEKPVFPSSDCGVAVYRAGKHPVSEKSHFEASATRNASLAVPTAFCREGRSALRRTGSPLIGRAFGRQRANMARVTSNRIAKEISGLEHELRQSVPNRVRYGCADLNYATCSRCIMRMILSSLLSNGVKRIFGTRFPRVKPPSRQGDEAIPLRRRAAKRGKRWKRAALLIPVLLGLSFVAVVEGGYPAAGKAGTTKGALFAALADPLSLFADRSPGGRGAGPLLSTKPPHERVLSEVRDREPPVEVPPAADNPVFGVPPEGPATSGAPPGDDSLTEDSFGGPGSSTSYFNPAQPEFLPFSQGPAAPSGPGPGTGITAVPEPATWAMLILGFFAVGAAMRRHRRMQFGAASLP